MSEKNQEKATVIITGVCGLLGTAIAEKLAQQYYVVGLDKLDSPSPGSWHRYFQVDLTSDEHVRHGLEQVREAFGPRVASVIHLAAYYSFTGEPSALYERVTIQGTERLLRELQNFQVEQFLFSSTLLVHAPTEPGRKITEESPVEAKWAYPQSKEETEAVIRARHGNIPFVIARIAGVYDEECHSIPIAHQIQRIYERQMTAHFYPGSLDCGQAFVHRQDLVEAVFCMVEQRSALPPEEIFLIGEDHTFSYGELQRRFGELIHGKAWATSQIPKPLAKTGAWLQDKTGTGDSFIKPWMIDMADDHYELDISHARRTLGWEPQHSLAATLPAMVETLKADPVGWYQKNKLELPPALRRKAG
jgi:nucleoside-diphosphate-sugar epimerase